MSKISTQPDPTPSGNAGISAPPKLDLDLLLRPVSSRVSDVLQIRPRKGTTSEAVAAALRMVAAEVKDGEKKARDLISSLALSTPIAEVTKRLNALGLDDTTRLLLSNTDIYGAIVHSMLDPKGNTPNKANPIDTVGFADAVLRTLDDADGFKHKYISGLVNQVVVRNALNLTPGQLKTVIQDLRKTSVPASPEADAFVMMRIKSALINGRLPGLLEQWASRKEIDQARLTSSINASMIRYLRERGVDFERESISEKLSKGEYDEYFALAYDRAVTSAEGSADPVTAATTGSIGEDWDFTVDTFDSIEEQGVVTANILAAGALDYNFELGERLGIFRLADAIVLNWAAGVVDVAGDIEKKLYRYDKLRDERLTEEERGMMYRRVLNKGEAEVLSRTVINESFPDLWDRLMYEAAQYIRKTEESGADTMEDSKVSRTPIFETTRLLQYNLTEFCTGMAHVHARETYSALLAAIEILKDPEVAAHYGGGRRGTLWTTIERLSRAEFGLAPNIAALRTLAVDGNRIFRWIAEFQRGTVSEDRFREFLEAAESYVLAKATVEQTLDGSGGRSDSENGDEFDDFSEFELDE